MNQAMTVDETPAGTLVVELTEDEYGAYLEDEVRRGTGLTSRSSCAPTRRASSTTPIRR